MTSDATAFPFPETGTFEAVAAQDLVRGALLAGATGRLLARDDKRRKALYLHAGRPVGAKSNQIGETLTRLAHRAKLLDEARYQQIVEKLSNGEHRMQGELLTEAGVPRTTVDALLARQTALRFADLCRWEKGTYQWQDGLPDDVPGAAVNPVQVFVELVKLKYTPKVFQRVVKHVREQQVAIDALAWRRFADDVAALTATRPFGARIEATVGKPLKALVDPGINGGEALKQWAAIYALIELGVLTPRDAAADATRSEPSFEQRVDERVENPELQAKLDELAEVNFFEVLGVAADVDARGVKRAYFKLAKQYHPDRFFDQATRKPSRTAEELFARINEAYEALRDDEDRAAYRNYLERGTTEEEEIRKAEDILKSEVAFQKALILMKRKNYQEAIEHLDQAIELHDEEPEYLVYLSWLKFLDAVQHRPADAEAATKELRHNLGRMPRPHAEGHFFLGRMLKMLGQTNEAKRAFERTLEIDSGHREAARELRALNKD